MFLIGALLLLAYTSEIDSIKLFRQPAAEEAYPAAPVRLMQPYIYPANQQYYSPPQILEGEVKGGTKGANILAQAKGYQTSLSAHSLAPSSYIPPPPLAYLLLRPLSHHQYLEPTFQAPLPELQQQKEPFLEQQSQIVEGEAPIEQSIKGGPPLPPPALDQAAPVKTGKLLKLKNTILGKLSKFAIGGNPEELMMAPQPAPIIQHQKLVQQEELPVKGIEQQQQQIQTQQEDIKTAELPAQQQENKLPQKDLQPKLLASASAQQPLQSPTGPVAAANPDDGFKRSSH